MNLLLWEKAIMMFVLICCCGFFLLTGATAAFVGCRGHSSRTLLLHSSSSSSFPSSSWSSSSNENNNHQEQQQQQPWSSYIPPPKNDPLQAEVSSSSTSAPRGDSNADNNNNIEYYNDFLPNPNPSFSAQDVVMACMDTLINVNKESGLEVCFHFSNDRCRAAIGGNLDNFNEYADNPTFGYLIHCDTYVVESIGPIISGTSHRGAMQTVLMSAIRNSKRKEGEEHGIKEIVGEERRRFLWTLEQERRPPLTSCWMVHEVLYTKNAMHLTL